MTLKFLSTIKNAVRWKIPPQKEKGLNLRLNVSFFNNDEKHFTDLFKIFSPNIISTYPVYDDFLDQLSKYTGVSSKKTILTNGADQGIQIICRLFFSKRSKVLIPSPVFPYYYHVLNLLGAEAIPVYYLKKKNDFIFPKDNILEHIDKVDGVILCNPNNPLGTAIDQNDIIEIVHKCHQHNIPCIIDEAYYEFHGETSTNLIEKYDNVIIIRTFSKFFSLAGLRLGYTLANRSIIKELLKIRGAWDINHFSIHAGSLSLQNIDFYNKRNIQSEKLKNTLYKLFEKHDISYYQSRINFILIDQQERNIDKMLLEKDIIISNLSQFPCQNNLLTNHIRLTIPNKDNFEKVFEELNRILKL